MADKSHESTPNQPKQPVVPVANPTQPTKPEFKPVLGPYHMTRNQPGVKPGPRKPEQR